MASGMFLIQDDGELIEMTERPYDSESLLQDLLARYPNLLAGDQMDSSSPRRWLLVSREAPLPSEEDGSGRWSVDHLFLDQDAIPTLVEVKRSTDTRIRREVVGQMLDYAANAVVYWPVETIRSQFEARSTALGREPEQDLGEFLGSDASPDDFWQKAKTNLQAGRVRLVFVADLIPPELRRVVEFLNEQMDPAEVLAVEIKQYLGSRLKTLVPRVIGQTAEAVKKKPGATRVGRQWDEASLLDELARRGGADSEIARKILEWAKARGIRIWWGKGSSDGSFYPMVDHDGASHYLVGIRTGYKTAYVQVAFRDMKARPPFDDEARRQELRRRLNEIKDVDISADALAKYPSFQLSLLNSQAALKRFLDALDWAVQEIRSVR